MSGDPTEGWSVEQLRDELYRLEDQVFDQAVAYIRLRDAADERIKRLRELVKLGSTANDRRQQDAEAIWVDWQNQRDQGLSAAQVAVKNGVSERSIRRRTSARKP